MEQKWLLIQHTYIPNKDVTYIPEPLMLSEKDVLSKLEKLDMPVNNHLSVSDVNALWVHVFNCVG